LPDLPRHSDSHDGDVSTNSRPARRWQPYAAAVAVAVVIIVVITLHLTGVIDSSGGH
jgi:hypothetical protein